MFPVGQSAALLSASLLALVVFAGSCSTDMGGTMPAGDPVPAGTNVGPQGPPGPQGIQGPQGPPGPAGSDATVTAGDGVMVNAGEVSLDTAFVDGLYWKQGGNANTDPATKFLGTTDDQPMDLRVDNQRAARFEHVVNGAFDSINVMAGSPANAVEGAGTFGATIAGGGYLMNGQMHGNTVTAKGGTIGGGWDNEAGELGTVGGGSNNRASAFSGMVGGGHDNRATDLEAAVCGGADNQADGLAAFVGGGQMNYAGLGVGAVVAGGTSNESLTLCAVGGGTNNHATGIYSTIGGGSGNTAFSTASTVPGGFENRATGAYSFAAGYRARADDPGCFVWCDPGMTNGASSFTDNQFLAVTTGGVVLQRTDPLNGSNITESGAAVMIEKLNDFGEALWIWQRREQPDAIPVIKIHRNSNDTNNNNFMEGWDWSGPGLMQTLVRKWHINKNGTFVAGGDFAESLPAVGGLKEYQPGDVVVLSATAAGSVEKCSQSVDSRVAGVYSTRPGLLGADKGGKIRVDKNDIPVAIVGVVPTNVTCENGPIYPGDLLVTSSTPGHAMRAKPALIDGVEVYPTGALLGKAMEPLEKGRGLIRVLVSLR